MAEHRAPPRRDPAMTTLADSPTGPIPALVRALLYEQLCGELLLDPLAERDAERGTR